MKRKKIRNDRRTVGHVPHTIFSKGFGWMNYTSADVRLTLLYEYGKSRLMLSFCFCKIYIYIMSFFNLFGIFFC